MFGWLEGVNVEKNKIQNSMWCWKKNKIQNQACSAITSPNKQHDKLKIKQISETSTISISKVKINIK